MLNLQCVCMVHIEFEKALDVNVKTSLRLL